MSSNETRGWSKPFYVAMALALLAGCSEGSGRAESAGESERPAAVTLTFAAYTTPREAYGEILRAFQQRWSASHHQEVRFRESYQGSGAQARAVIAGFDADVVALSLEQDVQKIADAGLITHDFRRAGPLAAQGGMVTYSAVVLAVRQGNPKGIREWDDLRREGVEVLTPNVRTSGGAMWNVAAIWGAVLRGHTGAATSDAAGAEAYLGEVIRRVRIMDRGARESMLTFERGVGDVAITYENEVLLGRVKGQTYEYVVPASTIRIENPVAIVDRNVERHGTREVAEAFVAFLVSEEVQRIYARHGLRPVHAGIAEETRASFAAVQDLFTVADLGGWPTLERTLFAPGAAYERAANGGP